MTTMTTGVRSWTSSVSQPLPVETDALPNFIVDGDDTFILSQKAEKLMKVQGNIKSALRSVSTLA